MNNFFYFRMLVLLLSALACMGLLLFVTLPSETVTWSALQNLGHFVLFSFFSAFFVSQIDVVLPYRYRYKFIITFLVLTIIGVCVEVLQNYMPGRVVSIDDVLRNIAGVLTGISVYGYYRYRGTFVGVLSFILLCSALVFFVWSNQSLVKTLGYALFKSDHPNVVNFNDPFVNSIISTKSGASSSIQKIDNFESDVLFVSFSRKIYSSLVIDDPGGIWTTEKSLVFDFYNTDSNTRKVNLRIHDEQYDDTYHDRFNTSFEIVSGYSEIRIPVKSIYTLGSSSVRNMNLEKIRELQLFSTEKIEFSLYLLRISLAE